MSSQIPRKYRFVAGLAFLLLSGMIMAMSTAIFSLTGTSGSLPASFLPWLFIPLGIIFVIHAIMVPCEGI